MYKGPISPLDLLMILRREITTAAVVSLSLFFFFFFFFFGCVCVGGGCLCVCVCVVFQFFFYFGGGGTWCGCKFSHRLYSGQQLIHEFSRETNIVTLKHIQIINTSTRI